MGGKNFIRQLVNGKWDWRPWQGADGRALVDNRGVVFYVWSGGDDTNAPSDVPMGSIGFDGDGAASGNVYVYDSDGDQWQDTLQSVSGFFGV